MEGSPACPPPAVASVAQGSPGGEAVSPAAGAAAAAAAPCVSVRQVVTAFQAVHARRAALYAHLSDGFKSYLSSRQEAPFRKLLSDLTAAFSACSLEVISAEAVLKASARPDLAALLRRVQEAERDKLRLTLTWQALKQALVLQDADGTPTQQQQHSEHQHQHAHHHQQHAQHPSPAAAALSHAHAAPEASAAPPAAAANGHGAAAAGAQDGATAAAAAAAAPASSAGVTAIGEAVTAGQEDEGEKEEEGGGGHVDPALALLADHQSRMTASHAENGGGDGGGHEAHGGGCGCGSGPVVEPPTEAELTAAMGEALLLLDGTVRAVNDALEELRYEVEDLPEEEGEEQE